MLVLSESPAAAGSGGKAPDKKALWRKITCGVAPILCTGLLVMMIILVLLAVFGLPDYNVSDNVPSLLKLVSVPDWLENSKEAMVDLEKDNLVKINSERAQYVAEIYGRAQEDVLKLQAIAGQVLPRTPYNIVVDEYVQRYPGLEQAYISWDNSVWYIAGFDVEEAPKWNSSLQALLKRSSLLETTFRGIEQQHLYAYVAALENTSSSGSDHVSDINLQAYPAFNMVLAGYLEFTLENGCDDRFTEYGDDYLPNSYDPRCRAWYQDAVEGENTGAVFTIPYSDAASGKDVVTVAAPVFNSGTGSELLGVAAIDIEYTEIEQAVKGYTIVANEGYTYLLAPGSSGKVLVHSNRSFWGTRYIADIEDGVDKTTFSALVARMSAESSGNESYSKAGETWLLSWAHMDTRIPSATRGQLDVDSSEDFVAIAVSTVSEAAFLEHYNEMKREIRNNVIAAVIFITVFVIAVGVIIACLARSLAWRITQPLAKLVDVVKALKRKDSSLSSLGLEPTEGFPSPELEDLVRSFEDMTTIIKFSTTSLRNGDLEAAQKKYMDALVLFEKLGNDRGVSIVYNNLGNIYTMQAKDLVQKAAASKNKVQAGKHLKQADANFNEATTSFMIAIKDAEALYYAHKNRRDSKGCRDARSAKGGEDCKRPERDEGHGGTETMLTKTSRKWEFFKRFGSSSSAKVEADADANNSTQNSVVDSTKNISLEGATLKPNTEKKKEEGTTTKAKANVIASTIDKENTLSFSEDGDVDDDDDDIEAQEVDLPTPTPKKLKSNIMSSWFCWNSPDQEGNDGDNSVMAFTLQLFSRKFNLALCLAAKGSSTVSTGGVADPEAIDEARKLLWECAELADGMRDAKGDQRHVECLLELATLECNLPGREKQAGEALDATERVIVAHRGARRQSLGRVYKRKGDTREESLEGTGLSAPLSVLRQQLLTARGSYCLTTGDPDAAITQWTDAILDCGGRMDVSAVLSSLEGLRELAVKGLGGRFPPHFLAALGLPKGVSVRGPKNQKLIAALDVALAKVDSKAAKYTRVSEGILGAKTTNVDLCFVMDCTQSMQTWIDQFNKKLLPTIDQAKSEVLNINLRVAFVGYRDFGDQVQYEGPFNFHSEEDLPELAESLKNIKADGGNDIPDDLAGGLNLTLNLSWTSPIRIMMVITDAPCHGSMYHDLWDNYPKGCPRKLDPSKLLYTLQYQLGVDVYFVRISTQTDKMFNVLENNISVYMENRKHVTLPPLRGSSNTEPKFLVHDLGVNKLRFSEAVVQSIKVSSGISKDVETY